MENLRVLSYNIHKGFGRGLSREKVLAKIREAIRASGADLVFLQEISGNEKEVQFEYLADSVWTYFSYGKNAVYPEGHHGNAILSKYPIIESENVDLSNHRWERRGLLHTMVDWKAAGLRLHTLCVHLDLLHLGRKKQARRILQRIEESIPKNEPLILAGDFNDWSGSLTPILRDEAGLQEIFLGSYGEHARTFPSWLPILALDRIYVRGLSFQQARVLHDAPWSALSDHLALYAEVALR